MVGATHPIFLIVDRGPAHRAKKTKALVETLGGKLRLFFLPPYSPDRNPDELVWKHLKADTVGRRAIQSYADFKGKAKSSMLSLQRNTKKIRSFTRRFHNRRGVSYALFRRSGFQPLAKI
jgi:transposase